MIVSSLAFLFWGEYLSLIQIFHYWDSQTPGLRENSSEIKMEPSVMCVCVCVCHFVSEKETISEHYINLFQDSQ